MKKNQLNKLLIIRDVLSREIHNLENKLIESRIYKMKYKYLEERKQILEDYIKELDNFIIEGKKRIFECDDITTEELPVI